MSDKLELVDELQNTQAIILLVMLHIASAQS
jgi:hypothetical protein